MSRSLIVIGAGLAGLFATVVAARRGATVSLVAEGRGGLSLSHGCIDVWRDGDVRFSSGRLARGHPLSLAGRASLESAFETFLGLMRQVGQPFVGSLDRTLRLPTALGGLHVAASAPASLASGALEDGPATAFHLGQIVGLRDFSAVLAASGLQAHGLAVRGTIDLPLPPTHAGQHLNAQDVALHLEDESYRLAVADDWRPRLHGVRRLGLPAVLGRDHTMEVLPALEQALGLDLFEIPTLPPTVPGLRLERSLRRLAIESGVDIIEGPSARGEIDGRSGGRLTSGVVTTAAGGPRVVRAQAVLLATGGPLHGGWMSFPNGEVQEAVFGLPVDVLEEREAWAAPTMFDEQPYARFGLRVDSRFRPCDRRGRPFFDNLFAAGGILAGADRTLEGSRQGIDLASAFAAVEAALG